jgi:hypothetical protein
MRFSSPGDHWDDASRSQFRAFFNRPLHAIELENGKSDRNLNRKPGWNLRPKFKFNSVLCDGRNAPATHLVSGSDVEFLADAGTKHAG